MSKKLFFIIPSYNVGGTTVSTRNLISLLEKEGYECWAMPLIPEGLLSDLYHGVSLVDTPFIVRALHIKSWKHEPSRVRRIMMAFIRFLKNHCGSITDRIEARCINRIIRKLKFDSVIACQEGTTSKVVSALNAPNKVAWVRCDYKRRLEDTGLSRDGFYGSYNAIVCVSEQTCDNFKLIFPEYESKTFCIPNPQDAGMIVSRANVTENEPRFTKEGRTLVSIGRFDAIKRFDHIAPIARQLCDNGLQFRWYLIGDGSEKERIVEAINNYKVGDCVILLGVKTNPYYYLQGADALVCLSRSEACPRVVNEAKVLHTPTVSTDFPTIYEFIQNGETGIIAPLEQLPLAIIQLFNDECLYGKIQDSISHFTFDNTELLRKLCTIL